jgi:hypothetical protein
MQTRGQIIEEELVIPDLLADLRIARPPAE